MTQPITIIVLLFAVLTFPCQAAHDEYFNMLLKPDDDAAAADRPTDRRAICEVDCAAGDFNTFPHLQDACNLHERCVQVAEKSETHTTYPNLNPQWCADSLEGVFTDACEHTEAGTEDSKRSLQTMSNVVLIAEGTPPNGFQAPVTCDLEGESNTCVKCVDPIHRGGVLPLLATSFACAWDGLQCRQAEAGVAMSDLTMCRDYPSGSSSSELEVQANLTDRASNKTREPKKKAVLIAYRHRGFKTQLDGSFGDVVAIAKHLIDKEDWWGSDISVLTDIDDWEEVTEAFADMDDVHLEWTGDPASGTAAQFMSFLQRGAQDLQNGDFFVFHFSGHGTYRTDRSGDELDGQDELLYTPSTETVSDDDFYRFLTSLPEGVQATIAVDACHSEGFSDLPFNYDDEERTWCTDWTAPRDLPRAHITYVSGAQNSQESDDDGTMGALTKHLLTGSWMPPAKAWTSAAPLHTLMSGVRKKFGWDKRTQVPNVAAFPMFADDDPHVSLWDDEEQRSLRHPRSQGGPNPGYGWHMRVPYICDHGEGENTRRADLVAQAQTRFAIIPELYGAEDPAWRKQKSILVGWAPLGNSAQNPQRPQPGPAMMPGLPGMMPGHPMMMGRPYGRA